jgi:hypothetical protein
MKNVNIADAKNTRQCWWPSAMSTMAGSTIAAATAHTSKPSVKTIGRI